jgi:ubiquinone/menaquinone biosynthesis C-methylase UbiE
MQASPYYELAYAAAYDRLALPLQFAAPATDLVRLTEPAVGDRFLDVGSGTGAVVVPAARMLGPDGMVVATDASFSMLAMLKRKSIGWVAAAKVPELPFSENCFDIVTASFVVSHFEDYKTGLAEMVRVLRPGGRLGVSAWAPAQNPYADTWAEIAGRFANIEELARSFHEVIPWDESLSTEDDLRGVLAEAGLVQVGITRRTYAIVVSSFEYLQMRELGVEGTFLRRSLRAVDWERFKQDLAEAFRERFTENLEFDRDVLFAVGRKPAG